MGRERRLCGSAPAAPRLWQCPASSPRSLPALPGQTGPGCGGAHRAGDSLKFNNAREGSVALKVLRRCSWNLGMAGGSLVAADVDSKRWRRLRVQSSLRKRGRREEGCQALKGLRRLTWLDLVVSFIYSSL